MTLAVAAHLSVLAMVSLAQPYNLTVTHGTIYDGAANVGSSGDFAAGTVLTVEADDRSPRTFIKWVGAPALAFALSLDDATQPSTTYTVPTDDVAIEAVYSPELVVNNGTGSGFYFAGAVIDIAADDISGKRFVEWTGDVATVGDVTQEMTTVTLPADNSDVTVTAVYENIPAAQPTGLWFGWGLVDEDGEFEAFTLNTENKETARVQISLAKPGELVRYTTTEDPIAPGPSTGTLEGFADGLAFGRTWTLTITGAQQGFLAVVSITLTADELAGLGVTADGLELHELDTDQSPAPGVWFPAGTNLGQVAPTGTLGDSGYIALAGGGATYWAVVDHLGIFAVGGTPAREPETPEEPEEPAEPETPVEPETPEEPGQPIPDITDDEPTEGEGTDDALPWCGACGTGAGQAVMISMIGLFLAGPMRRRG